jgi:hypothetical protein
MYLFRMKIRHAFCPLQGSRLGAVVHAYNSSTQEAEVDHLSLGGV